SGVSAEAAIKYFVLGAIASGTLLYGMSMLYGLTGTLSFDKLATISIAHGAPVSVTLLISTAPKLASFALVIRLLTYALGADPVLWVQMLTALAVLSV